MTTLDAILDPRAEKSYFSIFFEIFNQKKRI